MLKSLFMRITRQTRQWELPPHRQKFLSMLKWIANAYACVCVCVCVCEAVCVCGNVLSFSGIIKFNCFRTRSVGGCWWNGIKSALTSTTSWKWNYSARTNVCNEMWAGCHIELQLNCLYKHAPKTSARHEQQLHDNQWQQWKKGEKVAEGKWHWEREWYRASVNSDSSNFS